METFLIRLWVPDEPEVFAMSHERAFALHGVIEGGREGSPRPFANPDELIVGLSEALAGRMRERRTRRSPEASGG